MHAIADFAQAPTTTPETTMGSVVVLRWPDEEDRRRRLERSSTPRLLVVGQEDEAPPLRDDLEDWLRDPPSPGDLIARLAVLAERAEQARRRPRLDDDGLLWSAQRWVVIPDTQLCIVELLLAHPNELVTTATLTATYVRNGSSGHRSSVRTMLNRVVARFDQVGLQLHIVRGKGALLELPGR
jgi:DNA-binding response OmpR family regulator